MKTTEFDYALPPELIAQTPIEPRDAARLLVVGRDTQTLEHRHFHDLPAYLQAGDLLIFNESRVIPARLFARKPTGGRAEILLLRAHDPYTWEALVGGRRVGVGTLLQLLDGPDGAPVGVAAEVLEEGERGLRVLRFEREVLPLAGEVGVMPLPPYIHEPLRDAERYQTVYSRTPGSAAAPTAGLHFTPELLLCLREAGVETAYVTLHVGMDTFQPVAEEEIEQHTMHTEWCTLTPQTALQINQARLQGRRVIAVGTTAVRVLESAAQKAVQLAGGGCPWQAVAAYDGPTDLFIYPGYRYRAVDVLITNFHLPRSTLLMLVAAFAGRELLARAYAEAVRSHYRFYSFGDAMLIL